MEPETDFYTDTHEQPDTQETITDADGPVISFVDDTDNNQTNKIPVVQQLVLLSAIILLLLGGTLTPKIIAFFQETAEATPAAPSYIESKKDKKPTADSTQKGIVPFSEVSIVGEAAYVWDIQSQRALYKKEDSKPLPIASVTKLMTALVTYELLAAESDVTIGDIAIRQDGDSGLLQGETFDRETLSDLVLMSSSNDGAYAMAVAAGGLLQKNDAANAFVHAMNIRAEELNLHDTYFKNPTGLDISQTEGGAYGSAKDMAFLMEYIVLHQPDLLASTQEDQTRVYSQDGIYHDAVNTNYYIDEIPGIIGSKTGYTDLAGGNLIVAFDAGLNRPIIISVLGSTRQERFTDIMTLVKEVQQYVTQQ